MPQEIHIRVYLHIIYILTVQSTEQNQPLQGLFRAWGWGLATIHRSPVLLFRKSTSLQAPKPHQTPRSSREAGGTQASQDLLVILNCSWQQERGALGVKAAGSQPGKC